MKTKNIILKKDHQLDGVEQKLGTQVEVSEDYAKHLVESGLAKEVATDKQKAPEAK